MDNTIDPIKIIRDRLTALNTKGYYLLVALSFLYSKNPTLSLKLALTLTAIVAVLPVQDRLKSQRALSIARWSKAVLLVFALGFALWWVWCAAVTPTVAAQKPAPPQPAEQQKPEESAANPESRLKAIEEKADRALMEKDYIERTQKEVNAYYEKAFNTMITIFGLISVIIAVIAIVAGKLSLGFFDRRAQTAIAEASTQLRTEITAAMNTELDKLRKENASQNKDFSDRSNYLFLISQGLIMGAALRFAEANDSFRRALKLYKASKPRHLIPTHNGVQTLRNLFTGLSKAYPDPDTFQEKAKEELADALYDELHDELHDELVMEIPGLAPLIKERKLTLPQS
jgi:hypothetical protein